MASKKTAKKTPSKSTGPKFGSPAWNAMYHVKPFAKKKAAK